MNSEYPPFLDGARVLFVASVDHPAWDPVTLRNSLRGVDEPVASLAIARYGEDPQVYLFYCNVSWEVLGDTFHDSEADAIEEAEYWFPGVSFTSVFG